MCVICALLSLSRIENVIKRMREKKKKTKGAFLCAPSNDGNSNRRTVFIFSNKSPSFIFFSSPRFCFSCAGAFYSTTTITIIHLTSKRCFFCDLRMREYTTDTHVRMRKPSKRRKKYPIKKKMKNDDASNMK
jgi:hypothetical protein